MIEVAKVLVVDVIRQVRVIFLGTYFTVYTSLHHLDLVADIIMP